MPFSTWPASPVHPGIQLGTEFPWKESDRYRLYPAISIGYLFHRKLFQGLYLNAEVGFDFKLKSGLNLKTALGTGYLRTFTTRQEYQFKDGSYQSKADKGNSRVMPSLSFGLGYRLHPSKTNSAEIFIMHQTWLEFPYSPGFIPLMSHTNWHLGTKFYPFKNHQ
jgi:hypothetical protein